MTDRGMYQQSLDTEALSTAIVALTKIEELEKHSNAQYLVIETAQKELKSDMRSNMSKIDVSILGTHRRIDRIWAYGVAIGGTIILLLLTIIGYLVTNGTPWTH